MRILTDREVEPALSGPLLGRLRELNLSINLSVHAIGMGRGNVVLDDNFGVGIQPFDAPDELDRVACVLLGRGRRTYHERKLGDDTEFPDTRGEFQGLL